VTAPSLRHGDVVEDGGDVYLGGELLGPLEGPGLFVLGTLVRGAAAAVMLDDAPFVVGGHSGPGDVALLGNKGLVGLSLGGAGSAAMEGRHVELKEIVGGALVGSGCGSWMLRLAVRPAVLLYPHGSLYIFGVGASGCSSRKSSMTSSSSAIFSARSIVSSWGPYPVHRIW
jgi:hypothetical protein